MKQLSEQQMLQEPHECGNSIAIIVNHLHGNMLSRWTDFLNSDGEKSWRMRDREFEAEISNKKQLMDKWDQGWTCLLNALNALTSEDINAEILIRNQKHRVYEAIHRQLAHYASHIGQIILIGKMMKGTAWQTLSIAKGASGQFNQQKFSKGVHGGHFTQEFMGNDPSKEKEPES